MQAHVHAHTRACKQTRTQKHTHSQTISLSLLRGLKICQGHELALYHSATCLASPFPSVLAAATVPACWALTVLGSWEEVFTHDGSSKEKLKRNQSHLCWNKHLLCVQYRGNRAHKMHRQPSKGSWHITAISTCWKQAGGVVTAQWGAQMGMLGRKNLGQS